MLYRTKCTKFARLLTFYIDEVFDNRRRLQLLVHPNCTYIIMNTKTCQRNHLYYVQWKRIRNSTKNDKPTAPFNVVLKQHQISNIAQACADWSSEECRKYSCDGRGFTNTSNNTLLLVLVMLLPSHIPFYHSPIRNPHPFRLTLFAKTCLEKLHEQLHTRDPVWMCCWVQIQ